MEKKFGRTRQATDDNAILRMRIARWIPKATNAHLEYVTLIAFPWQQWSCERASMLRYTRIARLVIHEQINCIHTVLKLLQTVRTLFVMKSNLKWTSER